MTQYRQILRLHSQGISQRSIARSCQCSRNTVASVLQRAGAANLTWPLDVETDADLERLLFPEKQEHVSLRRMPDFEKVSKELARSGVTLKLLWMEYCEECRQLGDPTVANLSFDERFAMVVDVEYWSRHNAQFASTDCSFRMSGAGSLVEAVWVSGWIFYLFKGTGISGTAPAEPAAMRHRQPGEASANGNSTHVP